MCNKSDAIEAPARMRTAGRIEINLEISCYMEASQVISRLNYLLRNTKLSPINLAASRCLSQPHSRSHPHPPALQWANAEAAVAMMSPSD